MTLYVRLSSGAEARHDDWTGCAGCGQTDVRAGAWCPTCLKEAHTTHRAPRSGEYDPDYAWCRDCGTHVPEAMLCQACRIPYEQAWWQPTALEEFTDGSLSIMHGESKVDAYPAGSWVSWHTDW